MKPLNQEQIKGMVGRLENDLFMLQTNLSVIDQSEDSYTEEDRAYTAEAFAKRTATEQAIDGIQLAINNLKDYK